MTGDIAGVDWIKSFWDEESPLKPPLGAIVCRLWGQGMRGGASISCRTSRNIGEIEIIAISLLINRVTKAETATIQRTILNE